MTAWDSFPGLWHEPLTVFTGGTSGRDIAILTHYGVTFKNGKYVSGHSMARYELVRTDGKLLVHTLTIYTVI